MFIMPKREKSTSILIGILIMAGPPNCIISKHSGTKNMYKIVLNQNEGKTFNTLSTKFPSCFGSTACVRHEGGQKLRLLDS